MSLSHTQHEIGQIAGLPVVIDIATIENELVPFFQALDFSGEYQDSEALKSHNHLLGFLINKINLLISRLVILKKQIEDRIGLTKTVVLNATKCVDLILRERDQCMAAIERDVKQLSKDKRSEEKNRDEIVNTGNIVNIMLDQCDKVLNEAKLSPQYQDYADDLAKVRKNLDDLFDVYESTRVRKDLANQLYDTCERALLTLGLNMDGMSTAISSSTSTTRDATPSSSLAGTPAGSRRSSQQDIPETIKLLPSITESKHSFYQPVPAHTPEEQPKPKKTKCCCIL